MHTRNKWFGYAASLAATLLVFALLAPFYNRVDSVTVAASLLMVVLLAASLWGFGPAVLVSLTGVVYLNFFFIAEYSQVVPAGDDLVALIMFGVTAATVAQLSSRARAKAREAEDRRQEAQRLYDDLRAAFDRASQVEAARQNEQFKATLLDAVTHDLRTPLTSIKAAATSLRSLQLPSDSTAETPDRELVQIVIDETDRLNHFIEGMIELAKAQSRHDQKGPMNRVEEIVAAAVERARASGGTQEFRAQFDEAAANTLHARALTQVLFNALENASRFAPPGTAIQISASRTANAIRIAVQDEGTGIPAEDRERVFERFYRRTASEAGASGLGLGLAIARAIITAYGGRIWISGRADRQPGACVTMEVPLLQEAQKITAEAPASA